jgi:hypothetical protein
MKRLPDPASPTAAGLTRQLLQVRRISVSPHRDDRGEPRLRNLSVYVRRASQENARTTLDAPLSIGAFS